MCDPVVTDTRKKKKQKIKIKIKQLSHRPTHTCIQLQLFEKFQYTFPPMRLFLPLDHFDSIRNEMSRL